MQYDDEKNSERLEILYKAQRPLATALAAWNAKDPKKISVFSSAHLLPLSSAFEGGEVSPWAKGLSIGEARAFGLLIGWYKSANRNQTNRPEITHPEWKRSIERVQQYVEAELEQDHRQAPLPTAPWVVLTKPANIPLLNGLKLHLDHPRNNEGLLPNRTEWSQSLYLAGRFKERSLFAWINKKHPEWLDDNGAMVPRSEVEQKSELTPLQAMELDYVLSELVHLRDLERLGPVFLEDHLKGEDFYCRVGMHEYAEADGGYVGVRGGWNRKSEEEQAALRRWKSLTPDISLAHWVDRDRDFANIASKAQVIMAMAKEKGQPIEEALYLDPKTDEMHEALMFRSDWLTSERLQMFEGWLAQYQSHGLEQDKKEYQGHLMSQGISEIEAAEQADRAFEERVKPGIAETFRIFGVLQEAVKHTITDRVHDYIGSYGKGSASGFRHSDIEIFGCSVDDSRLHEELVSGLKEACAHGQAWHTRRGYDYAMQDTLSKRAVILGHLGQDKVKHATPGGELIPITNPISQTNQQYAEEARLMNQVLEEMSSKMEQLQKLSKERREEAVAQYEARLRVLETLYQEQAKYLYLAAESHGYPLPPVKEPNPRYEGLKKINKDPGDEVKPYITYEIADELKPMAKMLYPEAKSISLDEAAALVGELAVTSHASKATLEGAQNMGQSHEEIMARRKNKGLTTYGWTEKYKAELDKQAPNERGRQSSAQPAGTPDRPRFI